MTLTIFWLFLVVAWFRRSTAVLIAGLTALGLLSLAALLTGRASPSGLGLGRPASWPLTIGEALGWLGLMLAYSPLADRLASRRFAQPPALEAFGAVRQSTGRLIAGILVAWALGGFLEELVARGIVLRALEALLAGRLGVPLAAGIAVLGAALGAGLMHSYQGPRAMVIVAQLSVLFGLLFVLSGYNLWAVVLCHGLYDTIGFVRFATGKSRYSLPGSSSGPTAQA